MKLVGKELNEIVSDTIKRIGTKTTYFCFSHLEQFLVERTVKDPQMVVKKSRPSQRCGDLFRLWAHSHKIKLFLKALGDNFVSFRSYEIIF